MTRLPLIVKRYAREAFGQVTYLKSGIYDIRKMQYKYSQTVVSFEFCSKGEFLHNWYSERKSSSFFLVLNFSWSGMLLQITIFL